MVSCHKGDSVITYEYDFGSIFKGDELSHLFPMDRTFLITHELVSVKKACACLKTKIELNNGKPGFCAEVDSSRIGLGKQNVIILAKYKNSQTLYKYVLTGYVFPVTPESINVGPVLYNQTKSDIFVVRCKNGAVAKYLGSESTDKRIVVENITKKKYDSDILINCRININNKASVFPCGNLDTVITIFTGTEDMKECHKVRILGYLYPPILINPPAISVGVNDATSSFTKNITFRNMDVTSSPLMVKYISTDYPDLNVKQIGQQKDCVTYAIKGTIRKGKIKNKILFNSNRAEQDMLEIFIYGYGE
ncbi:MAG: hypothetical protein ABFD69_07995 [Candidatus Sumerlaeia bacterium]